MTATVTIDNREADEVEAQQWRDFVRQNCRAGHDKPIRHFTLRYAEQLVEGAK